MHKTTWHRSGNNHVLDYLVPSTQTWHETVLTSRQKYPVLLRLTCLCKVPTCRLNISNTYKCWNVISSPAVVSEQWSLDWKPSHLEVMASRPRPLPDIKFSSCLCHVNVGICMKCTGLNESVNILFWPLAVETGMAIWVWCRCPAGCCFSPFLETCSSKLLHSRHLTFLSSNITTKVQSWLGERASRSSEDGDSFHFN